MPSFLATAIIALPLLEHSTATQQRIGDKCIATITDDVALQNKVRCLTRAITGDEHWDLLRR